jgi:NADPH:quinone reductase
VKVTEVADPSPGQGEVLIATEAATINPADFAVVTGTAAARLPWGSAPPYIPGWDLVGRVVAAGEGVAPAVIGSRVLGFSLWFESLRGTQAALVALPVGNVVPAADRMLSAQLTTVGLNGLTAWRGLADLKLANGETLVVTGAAGSVGGFAVELAAARGFTVIGVVREDQRQDALDLGASAVVSAGGADLGTAVREIVPGGADALRCRSARCAWCVGGSRCVVVSMAVHMISLSSRARRARGVRWTDYGPRCRGRSRY